MFYIPTSQGLWGDFNLNVSPFFLFLKKKKIYKQLMTGSNPTESCSFSKQESWSQLLTLNSHYDCY